MEYLRHTFADYALDPMSRIECDEIFVEESRGARMPPYAGTAAAKPLSDWLGYSHEGRQVQDNTKSRLGAEMRENAAMI